MVTPFENCSLEEEGVFWEGGKELQHSASTQRLNIYFTHILSGRVEIIVVVKIRQGREERLCAALSKI